MTHIKLYRSGVKYDNKRKHYTWKDLDSHQYKSKNMGYEHKIVKITDPELIQHTLNSMSDEGWELVAVVEERHYFKKYVVPVGKTGPQVL